MTSAQLDNLNSNLVPTGIGLTHLSTNDEIRNKLVYFFYQFNYLIFRTSKKKFQCLVYH